MVMTPSQAANRNQPASNMRGRDTIGKGTPKGAGGVYAGKDPIAFDTRSNTVHGEPKGAPDNRSNNAREVGDVMLAQEAKGRDVTQKKMDKFVSNQHANNHGGAGAMTFRIEEGNRAKQIDQDKPPQ
jgi:hypothetical protein